MSTGAAPGRRMHQSMGRGAGEGFGVHICTGPVSVHGAAPGDVTGGRNWAHAVNNHRWMPQTDPFGVMHRIIDYPGALYRAARGGAVPFSPRPGRTCPTRVRVIPHPCPLGESGASSVKGGSERRAALPGRP
jgi:hypothetical protein